MGSRLYETWCHSEGWEEVEHSTYGVNASIHMRHTYIKSNSPGGCFRGTGRGLTRYQGRRLKELTRLVEWQKVFPVDSSPIAASSVRERFHLVLSKSDDSALVKSSLEREALLPLQSLYNPDETYTLGTAERKKDNDNACRMETVIGTLQAEERNTIKSGNSDSSLM